MRNFMKHNSATIVRQPQFGSISPISDSETCDSEITTSAIPTSPSTQLHVPPSVQATLTTNLVIQLI